MSMVPSQFQDRRFCIIAAKSKAPKVNGWQVWDTAPAYDDKRLNEHIKNGGNYGILCGHGVLGLDWDDMDFAAKIRPELPPTFSVRTGAGKLHDYYYYHNDSGWKILGDDGEELVSIRGERQQLVGAGSTHPNGSKYAVEADLPIATLTDEQFTFIKAHQEIEEEHRDSKDEVVRQIKEKLSLSALLQDYGYDLTKNPTMCRLGHTSTGGKCFSWNDNKGWYCFHCGKGGDIFSLIMAHECIKFPEAKRRLAVRCGLVTEEESSRLLSCSNDDKIAIAQGLWEAIPFCFDTNQQFWIWNELRLCYEFTDEVGIINALEGLIAAKTWQFKSKQRTEMLHALRQVGRRNMPVEPPKTWVQFGSVIVDAVDGSHHVPSPRYFMTNTIPWELAPSSNTPVLDRLFAEWVVKEGEQGIEYVQTLHEILAYCCLRSQPLQRIFAFTGAGSNGKGVFQQIIKKFVGSANVVATDLLVLSSNNFAASQLHKKLVALVGDVGDKDLSRTNTLKGLSCDDLIRMEIKGRQPFEAYNYAKIVIATNSLPASPDRSVGFHRRWMIIDFPHYFPLGRDIMAEIPDVEYQALAAKCCLLLPKLMQSRVFTSEGSIINRTERYDARSNPVGQFIKESCVAASMSGIVFSEFEERFEIFCVTHNHRPLSKIALSRAIRKVEGYDIERTSFFEKGIHDQRCILGIDWKKEVQEVLV